MLRRHAWILLAVPLLASAWTREWWAPDEPRYAEVAREVARRGDWLVLHLCGEVYASKPPLLFWLSALCGQLFGWSEFALRLPVLVSTLVTAFLVQRLARRSWGETEANLAPLMYLSCGMVLWHGARLQIDPLLGALTTGALVLATEPRDSRAARARDVLGAGLLVGLAVLAKGPVALVLAGLPLAAWRWLDGPRRDSAPRAAVAGALILALAPGFVWALAVALRHPEVAYDLFVGQFFERAIAGRNHISPFWYHAEVQPLLMLPWTLPILAGSWLGLCALRARWGGAEFDAGSARAALWFWPLFLAFSASPEKRDLYLMPAYPALALLGARWCACAFSPGAGRRWIAGTGPALLGLAGLGLCAAGSYAPRLHPELVGLTFEPFALGLPMLAGAAIAAIAAFRGALGPARRTVAPLAAGLACTALAAAWTCFPRVNALKSSRELAIYVAGLERQPPAIPCFGVMPEGFRYYSNLPFVTSPRPPGEEAAEAHEAAFVSRERATGPRFLALVAGRDWARWSETTRSAVLVLRSQQVSGKEVLVVGSRGQP